VLQGVQAATLQQSTGLHTTCIQPALSPHYGLVGHLSKWSTPLVDSG